MTDLSIHLTTWLLTYAAHSSLLLGGVWALERGGLLNGLATREWLWKLALVGGLATASLQLALTNSSGPGLAADRTQATLAAPAPAPATPESRTALNRRDATKPGAATPQRLPAHATTGRGRTIRNQREPEAFGSGGAPIGIANPPIPRPDRVPLPIAGFAPWIALLWSVVAFALSLRLVTARRVARATLRRRETLRSGRAHQALRMLALASKRRRVPLSQADISGPLCLPGGEICIPAWAEQQLDDDQLRAMLAHELAHGQRRDPQWRILGLALNAVLFFQPLNRIATRRLDDLAELACDGAAARIGKGQALATCLAHFARRLVAQPAPAWTAAMARSEASIVGRVERLVSGDSEPGRALDWKAKLGAVGAVLALAVVTPGLALKEAQGDSRTIHRGTHVEVGDEHMEASLSYSDDDYHLSVEMEGGITVNAEETDVIGLDDGHFLKIREDGDQGDIRLVLHGQDGAIERSFWREGERLAWNDEAQSHLTRLLPTLFRELGLDMHRRVARLLDDGGAARVIDEIELMESDYVAASYIRVLAEAEHLDDGELERVLELSRELESDFELRRALAGLLAHQTLNPDRMGQMLDVGRGIGSDFESRQLLRALAPRLTGDAAYGVPAYLDMAADIDSDFEQRQALVALLNLEGLSRDDRIRVLESARTLNSDFEKRTLLGHAAIHLDGDLSLYRAYMDGVDAIGSDFEKRSALRQLLRHGPHPREGYQLMLQTSARIGSDYEHAQALISIARELPRDPDLLAAYEQSSSQIGSQHERERAERALRDELRGERRQGRREGRQEGRHEGRDEGRAGGDA